MREREREKEVKVFFFSPFFEKAERGKKQNKNLAPPTWLLPRTSASCRFVVVIHSCRVRPAPVVISGKREAERERWERERERKEERLMKNPSLLTANASPSNPLPPLTLTLSRYPNSAPHVLVITHRRSARSKRKEAARWPPRLWR